MTGHLARRGPAPGRRFSWGRAPLASREGGDAGVEYRLFRRVEGGGLVMESRCFFAADPRDGIARVLRGMRAQLRWAADRVEFERLGLTDPTPRPGDAP